MKTADELYAISEELVIKILGIEPGEEGSEE